MTLQLFHLPSQEKSTVVLGNCPLYKGFLNSEVIQWNLSKKDTLPTLGPQTNVLYVEVVISELIGNRTCVLLYRGYPISVSFIRGSAVKCQQSVPSYCKQRVILYLPKLQRLPRVKSAANFLDLRTITGVSANAWIVKVW